MAYYYKRPYMQHGYGGQSNYGYRNQYNNQYNKRPRYNQFDRRQPTTVALNVSNLIFISGQPGEDNKLLKNIVAPSCSIVMRCGISQYNLSLSLCRANGITLKDKLNFTVPPDSLLAAKLIDASEEPNLLEIEVDKSEESTNTAACDVNEVLGELVEDDKNVEENVNEINDEGKGENGNVEKEKTENKNVEKIEEKAKEKIEEKAKEKIEKKAEQKAEEKVEKKAEEKVVEKAVNNENVTDEKIAEKNEGKPEEKDSIEKREGNPYTQRLVLVLKNPISVQNEENEVIDKSILDQARIIIAEFKGFSANERIDPKSVLTKSLFEGPLKSYQGQNGKAWLKDGEYVVESVLRPFIEQSRKYENELSKMTECELCKSKFRIMQLENHKSSICEKREVSCAHCSEKMIYSIMESHMRETCEEVPLKCENGCSHGIKRKDLVEHAEKCPKKPVLCEFALMGCDRTVKLDRMEQHLRSEAHLHVRMLQRRVVALEEVLGLDKLHAEAKKEIGDK